MNNERQEYSKASSSWNDSIEVKLPDEIVAYRLAQKAMVDLKTAVYFLISNGPKEGYTNAEIGRKLGIYAGHVGHEGHISRTILGLLESEGILNQSQESKKWTIRVNGKD